MRHHRPATRWGIRLASIVVGLLLPLVALECALRLFGPILPGSYQTGIYMEPHAAYGRFHVPGFDGWLKSREFTSRVTINALGLRGPERDYPKPDGVRRILVLGDSFVEAAQVDASAGIVARLETLLNEREGDQYEVLNAGVSGWGQHQQLVYLEAEGLRYEPDIVIVLLYVGNDLADSSWELNGRPSRPAEPYFVLEENDNLTPLDFQHRRQPSAGPILDALRGHSLLWNILESGALGRLTGEIGPGEPADEFHARQMAAFAAEPTARVNEAWRVTLALLNRIVELAAQHQTQTIIVIAPAMFQVYDDDWDRLLSVNDLSRDAWSQFGPNDRIARQVSRIDAPVMDLLPIFRNAAGVGSPPLYYSLDRHWTEAGHALAARSIMRFLVIEGLAR